MALDIYVLIQCNTLKLFSTDSDIKFAHIFTDMSVFSSQKSKDDIRQDSVSHQYQETSKGASEHLYQG